eukprot:4736014-Prymnesium_polylepis.1
MKQLPESRVVESESQSVWSSDQCRLSSGQCRVSTCYGRRVLTRSGERALTKSVAWRNRGQLAASSRVDGWVLAAGLVVWRLRRPC